MNYYKLNPSKMLHSGASVKLALFMLAAITQSVAALAQDPLQIDNNGKVKINGDAIMTSATIGNTTINGTVAIKGSLEATEGNSLSFKTSNVPRVNIDVGGLTTILGGFTANRGATIEQGATIKTVLNVDGNLNLVGMFKWDDYRRIRIVTNGAQKYMEFNNTMRAGQGNTDGGFRFANHDGSEFAMRIRNNFVGIGTDDPQFPLHITSTRSNGGSIGENASVGFGRTPRFQWDNALSYDRVSIVAYGDIVSHNLVISAAGGSYSDARLKKNISLSSTKLDLQKLNEIRIVDYKMIDTLTDNKWHKKVIAQQVQKVYPTAVSLTSKTLPNVFQVARTVNRQADSLYTITVAKPQHVKAGDRVELKRTNGNDVTVNVTKINGLKSITVRSPVELEKCGDLFVYGTQANDVLVVDYDAIGMLNVSATQELAKLVTEQQTVIDQLKKQNAQIAAENSELRAEQANSRTAINSILSRLAKVDGEPAKVMASTEK